MIVFVIDGEQAMLDTLREVLAEAEPCATVHTFRDARAVLEALEAHGEVPDIVFSDVELPGMNGLALAKPLKHLVPAAKLVFVTDNPSYAVDAFRIHADGFIVKPIGAERIREELDALFAPAAHARPAKLHVRCFGNFDVFLDGKPLIFSRLRTKELFAFLVDRAGGTCTTGEIATALWEGKAVKSRDSYLRVLASDLRARLAEAGMEGVLIHKHSQWAIRTDMLDCDYLNLLNDKPGALRSYHGEYMKQYSWAEETAAGLYFRYGGMDR